jgi:hypothetical protein
VVRVIPPLQTYPRHPGARPILTPVSIAEDVATRVARKTYRTGDADLSQ